MSQIQLVTVILTLMLVYDSGGFGRKSVRRMKKKSEERGGEIGKESYF